MKLWLKNLLAAIIVYLVLSLIFYIGGWELPENKIVEPLYHFAFLYGMIFTDVSNWIWKRENDEQ